MNGCSNKTIEMDEFVKPFLFVAVWIGWVCFSTIDIYLFILLNWQWEFLFVIVYHNY